MSVDQEHRVSALRRRSRRTPAAAADPDGTGSGEAPLTPAPPRIPGRRNPKWIALGIVAICLGGLLSYVIYARVANESTVIAMAATVYRGQVVEASDLKTVTLSRGTTVATVPSDQLDSLVGKRAAFDLVEGALLPPEGIKATLIPASRRSVVGVKVAAGRAPSGFLVPGATVRLVVVPPPNAEPGFKDGYLNKNYAAIVVGTLPGPDAASTLVNVDVKNDQAAVVALLAATDRLTIVRDADR